VRDSERQEIEVLTSFYAAWKLQKKLHRGYHMLAAPTWERKLRVLAVWATAVPFGRDIVSLTPVQYPRETFLAGAHPAHDVLLF
jgi:hypothetical protein